MNLKAFFIRYQVVKDHLPEKTLLSVRAKCFNFRLFRVLKKKSTLSEVLNDQRVLREEKKPKGKAL